MVTRRAILWTGAGGVAVIGAGLGVALHSDLAKARAPWREAGTGFGDKRLDALSYAVLAPSPHNMQPWLVRLDEDGDALTLFCDLDRRLPATDPQDRQIVIGLGAFLELLRQSAAEQGYALQVDLFPEGEPGLRLDARPVATVRFLEDAETFKDPLFAQILSRRTSRVPFDQTLPVAGETLNALDAALRAEDGEFEWANDQENIAALKTMCRAAWRIEMETPATRHESAVLTRIGDDEINRNPDGISLFGPMMEGAHLAGMLNQKDMDEVGSAAYDATMDFYNGLIDSAMAFGWLSTSGNSRTDQLRAGGGWVRLQQAAGSLGLAMQPLSQALQEYSEMAEVYEEIHDFTGVQSPAVVQGLFRFGYAKPGPAAPRWPLESKLIPADA